MDKMNNQQKLIYINEKDLLDTIAYLKDYSEIIGKTYHKTNDFKVQQQIAMLNFDVNKLIIKLENERN